MTRLAGPGHSIDTDTVNALQADTLWLVWFLRLDIVNDPVYINTSFHDIYFPTSSGYDPALEGYTFIGKGAIGKIDPVTDSQDGSQALSLSLPGVDLTMDYLHQLVANGDAWQRRPAYLWVGTFDSTGTMLGKPVRVKTARMDQMPITIDPNSGEGTIAVTLESQNAYSGEALFTRWYENSQIDSTDKSQAYVSDLANRVPQIGNTSTNASGGLFYNNYTGSYQGSRPF